MKLLLIFILLIGNYYAQIREGILTYKVELSTENNEMKDALDMFSNSNLTIYFDAYRTRSEMNIGNVIDMITISNILSEEVTVLINSVSGKTAISSSISDYKMMIDTNSNSYHTTDSIIEIKGFECKEIITKNVFGENKSLWLTEAIFLNSIGHNFFYHPYSGTPLKYDIIYNGINMSLTLIDFQHAEKNALNTDQLFDTTIPEGYLLVTKDQLFKN